MSEPTHHAPSSSSSSSHGKGLNIPGIGKLPTWFVVGGLGLVVLLILRNRSGSGPAAAAGTSTDPAGNVGVIDPATGYVYGSPEDTAGLAASAGSQTPAATGTGAGSVGDQVTNGPPFTTNAAWSQYAVATLSASGYDPGTLSAELGLYLAGQGVTPSQQTDINAAIAVAGLPPVAGAGGKPPAINVIGSTAGGGGGSGSGSPHGGPITVTPVGLAMSHVYTNSAQCTWHKPTIPANQGPLTGYTVEVYNQHGQRVNGPFTVGPGQLYAYIGGLKNKTAYHVNVWCDPAKPGGPHATKAFTTK
jgi:hypothetical protein